jgi:ABC-2 type transport system ATP-binding protein
MDLNKRKKMTVFLTTHYIEEAEKMADRVAIIDRGEILANATVDKIKDMTNSKTLEEAFLKLTGKEIRNEEGGSLERLRQVKRIRR